METLDLTGLTENEVAYVQHIVEQFRHKKEYEDITDTADEVVFATHKSTVIGPLTRREIYEDV